MRNYAALHFSISHNNVVDGVILSIDGVERIEQIDYHMQTITLTPVAN